MDVTKMLEMFEEHIKNISDDELIKKLSEYDIEVINYNPGSRGSFIILGDVEEYEIVSRTIRMDDIINNELSVGTNFIKCKSFEMPMGKLNESSFVGSIDILNFNKYNSFDVDLGVA